MQQSCATPRESYTRKMNLSKVSVINRTDQEPALTAMIWKAAAPIDLKRLCGT